MGILFHLQPGQQLPLQVTPERQQLLDSALKIFSVHGYDRASLKQIAAEAKVTAAMVNYYFGTKHQLFVAVVDACFAKLSERVVRRTSGALPFAERLTGFIEAHAEFCAALPESAELIVRTAFRPDPLQQDIALRYAPLRELAHELFHSALKNQQLVLRPGLNAQRAADHLLGQVELLFIQRVQSHRFPKAEVPAFSPREVIDTFLFGVSAVAGDPRRVP